MLTPARARPLVRGCSRRSRKLEFRASQGRRKETNEMIKSHQSKANAIYVVIISVFAFLPPPICRTRINQFDSSIIWVQLNTTNPTGNANPFAGIQLTCLNFIFLKRFGKLLRTKSCRSRVTGSRCRSNLRRRSRISGSSEGQPVADQIHAVG